MVSNNSDYYNAIVLKYVSMAAYDKSVLHLAKTKWFDLSPSSSFAYKFVSTAVERYGGLDDATFYETREHKLNDCLTYVQTIHGVKATVLHNDIFLKLEAEINNVLRDVARSKDPKDWAARIESLRNALISVYDRSFFTEQLKRGVREIESGKSVEEVYLSLTLPDVGLPNEGTFEERADKMLKEQVSPPIYTGIDALDYNGGFDRGNLMVLGGDTGAMKTRFTLFLCLQILKHDKSQRCVFFEAEMTQKDVFYMVFGWLIGEAVHNVRKFNQDWIKAKISEMDDDTRDVLDRLIILDSNDFKSGDDIFFLVKKYRATFWVVDFLTMMVSGDGGSADVNMSVFRLTDALKECAKRTDTFGIIISQLKKGSVEARQNKVPVSDDLEWSGRLKQLGSYILMVFYPSYYYADVPPKYFFVKESKSRFSKRARLYFHAYPELCTFQLPADIEHEEMKDWWKNYERSGGRL